MIFINQDNYLLNNKLNQEPNKKRSSRKLELNPNKDKLKLTFKYQQTKNNYKRPSLNYKQLLNKVSMLKLISIKSVNNSMN